MRRPPPHAATGHRRAPVTTPPLRPRASGGRPGGSDARRRRTGRRGRGGARAASAGRDPPAGRRPGDGEVALPVGAVDLHPVAGQVLQRPGRGLAVRVVRTDRHQGDARAGRGQEPRVGVRAPVVRHLEHVGTDVDPPVEDALLGLGVEVAGEEDAHAALGDPHQQAEIVGRGRGGGDLGWRRQHLDRRGADRAAVSRHEGHPARPGAAGQRVDAAHPGVRRGQRAGGHLAHTPAGQRPGQAGHVVGVEVRQHHQRNVVDAQPSQAPVLQHDVRAGVDQYGLPRPGRHHEGVALPDVAGHEVGGSRRPAPHHLPQRPADRDHPDQGREERPGAPRAGATAARPSRR